MKDKKVTVFTSATCGYCTLVKDYLNENRIQFEEKNVSTNPDARKELMAKGFMGVPVIYIGDEIIKGFDKSVIDNLLGL